MNNQHDNPGHDPLENLYAYRPQRHDYKARRISIRTVLMVVVLVFVVVVWVAYPRGAERYQDVRLPLVRADHSPYKVKPESPGGQFIPHQDSTIFEPLESVQSDVIENILPDAEEPMGRDEIEHVVTEQKKSLIQPPSLNLDVQLTDKKEDIVKQLSPQKQKAKLIDVEKELAARKIDTENIRPQQQGQEVIENVQVKDIIEQAAIPKPAVKPNIEKPKTQVVKKAPVKPQTTSSLRYVQVGAFDTKPKAEVEYRKRVLWYGDLIADLNVNYEYADLGAKGVYFRVKLGPTSEAEARRICNIILDKKPGGCFVTK